MCGGRGRKLRGLSSLSRCGRPYFGLVIDGRMPMITEEQFGLAAERLIEEIRPTGYQGPAYSCDCLYPSRPAPDEEIDSSGAEVGGGRGYPGSGLTRGKPVKN